MAVTIRSAWVVALLLLVSCRETIILGVFVSTASDAGTFDAGTADAGTAVVDAGVPDAGLNDAGPLDAGPADAGVPDAGPPDAGPLDAGAPDAGPPAADLELVNVPVAYETGTPTASFDYTLRNRGELSAASAALTGSLAVGFPFVMGTDCTWNGVVVSCSYAGPIDAGARVTASALLNLPTESALYEFPASFTTPTMESRTDNNQAVLQLAITPVGLRPLAIVAPVVMTVQSCRGLNIATYQDCTGPVVVEDLTLQRDAGMQGLDGGWRGSWFQGAGTQNLVLNFVDGGARDDTFLGGSITTGPCFQGVVYDFAGNFNAGGWKGCIN